jgi:hypothetical protein
MAREPEPAPTKLSPAKLKGELGWNFVARVVLEAACKPIPHPEALDTGLDGFIEFPDAGDGAGLVALQVKRGPSFFGVNGARCPADAHHFVVWSRYPMPVIAIVVSDDASEAYWMDVRKHLQDHPDQIATGPFTLNLPREQFFDRDSLVGVIRGLALRSSGSTGDALSRLGVPISKCPAIPRGLQETTADVLGWQATLPDGTWLPRPELDEVRELLTKGPATTIALLGAPGSGKSAFLARLGSELRDAGWTVLAIKADRMPREIASLADLEVHLGVPHPVARAFHELGGGQRTVLLVDQLDALSDLVDLHTERLTAILALISAVSAAQIPIVCSVRSFDYQHDSRFSQLKAEEMRLAPLTDGAVDQTLRLVGFDPSRAGPKLRALLTIPHWLKLFIQLSWDQSSALPPTAQALMESVWQQRVLSPSTFAPQNAEAAGIVAEQVSEREELWVSRAAFAHIEPAIERLLAAGVLQTDPTLLRLGFAHQSLFEFARARAFVRVNSLSEHVIARQDSLFIRPTIWTALHYLRAAEPGRYRDQLTILWGSELRPHLRLLFIEFLGQLEDPEVWEISLLQPIFHDPTWGRPAFNAISQSKVWVRWARQTVFPSVISTSRASEAYGAMVASLKLDCSETLELMRRYWSGKPSHARLVIAVVRQLDDWTGTAQELLRDALPHVEDAEQQLDTFSWHLKTKAPAAAIDLIADYLSQAFALREPTLPRSAPLPEDASWEQKFEWRGRREPLHTANEIFRSASRFHVLVDLAEAEPEGFLRRFLPWAAAVLAHGAEANVWHLSYRRDEVCDCSGHIGSSRDLPDALRIAAETLAVSDSTRFIALLGEWTQSDLHAIHVVFSYGFEKLGATRPTQIVEYLAADARRLSLGEFSDYEARTIALLQSIASSVNPDDVGVLEAAILSSNPSVEHFDGDAAARRRTRDRNREYRLRLLSLLPPAQLTPHTRSLVEQETRTFGPQLTTPRHEFGLTLRGSPMSAAQMSRAADDEIVRLFDELPDEIELRHPERMGRGGAIEAAHEFAGFAKQHPERAIAIIERLSPHRNEIPVGDAVEALAASSLPTPALYELIEACDRRGFSSTQFRTDAARALSKRAGPHGLPQPAEALLSAWLDQVPTRARSVPPVHSDDNAGTPPFLSRSGGIVSLPAGNYAVLDALLVSLLSSQPPRTGEWLDLLLAHVERDEEPLLWRAFARRLVYLRRCNHEAATRLLNRLFARYPEVLSSTHGVFLAAVSSWWVAPEVVQSWVTTLRSSSWQHAKSAVGELTAFLGSREPPMAWAGDALSELVETSTDEEQLLGAIHALTTLWREPEARSVAGMHLGKLLRFGNAARDAVAFRALAHDQLAGDIPSQRLLREVAERKGPLPKESAHDIAEWLLALVQHCPDAVCLIAERMVQAAADAGDAQTALGGASMHLLNVATTLQRIPSFRSRGLTLFEALLMLNVYGVHQVLAEVDVDRRTRPRLAQTAAAFTG